MKPIVVIYFENEEGLCTPPQKMPLDDLGEAWIECVGCGTTIHITAGIDELLRKKPD